MNLQPIKYISVRSTQRFLLGGEQRRDVDIERVRCRLFDRLERECVILMARHARDSDRTDRTSALDRKSVV